MTLRLDEARTEALRRRAGDEQVSMQALAVRAIDEYLERHGRRDLIDNVLDDELPRYADALRRLGE